MNSAQIFKGAFTDNPEMLEILDMLRGHLRPIYPQLIGYRLCEAIEATLSQPGVWDALKRGPSRI